MKIGDVKAVPMKAADYGKTVHTCPVENFPEYRAWLKKLYSGIEGIKRMQWALTDNRKRFAKLFGPKAFMYRGEFAFHCWLLSVGSGRVLVLTAAGKGTCYEVVTHCGD